ncbi:hypothetical protein QR98_0029950 [Sarcoptes scabiei]|uniref:Uncharacterized protein n=1 Tax=Sarcoptes scabiei TaxID=52283 RepID=A0A132A1T0_SARSC|nr:hypothetical protein QR98_0029950 [Sarcoptes scabiei]
MINDLKAKLIQQAMMFKMIHTSSPSTSTSTLLFRSSVIPDNLIEIKAATLLSIKMCYLEKTKKKKEEKKKQQTTQEKKFHLEINKGKLSVVVGTPRK